MPRPKKAIKTQWIPGKKRFRVEYDDAPGKWFMSPESTREAAVKWASRNHLVLLGRAKDYLFSELAVGFFDKDGAWDRDQVEHGWKRTDATLAIYQGFLENHFLKVFGACNIQELEPSEINITIKSLNRINGSPYARGTRNKMLYALSLMFTYWRQQGLVKENPLEGVVKYNKAPEKPRSALPREVIIKLYPATHGEAIKLYGSPMYVAFFFAMNDTGARPGELRAIRWGQIDLEKRFVPIRTAIESGTNSKVKTTKTGIVRPGYLSERTVQELLIWKEQTMTADDMDFVFTAPGRSNPVSEASIGNCFERAMKRLGYVDSTWTPYYLRHSFGTYKLEILDEASLMLLMGHASSVTSKGYQHPDDETVYKEGLSVKDILDKDRGDKRANKATKG